jgi:hypothetical protein
MDINEQRRYKLSETTNTGFAGVSFSNGVTQRYIATNQVDGERKHFRVNSQRSYEMALVESLIFANER